MWATPTHWWLSVLDFDQIKAIRGGGCAGGAAVARLEDREDVRGRDASLAGEEKCANEVADHVVKEAVAADDVDELFGVTLKARFVNGADIGGGLESGGGFGKAKGAVGIDSGKGGEIVLSGDQSGGLLHGRLIQWIGVVSDVAGQKRRDDVAAPDAVVVALGTGGVARVEAFRHFIDGKDSNGSGQPVIEHDAEVCDRNGAGGLKGCDLRKGVNAGVGAPRALGEKLLSGKALDDGGQGALDGGLAGLNLPAVKGRAVIGEREFEGAGAHRLRNFQHFTGFRISQGSKVSQFSRVASFKGKVKAGRVHQS